MGTATETRTEWAMPPLLAGLQAGMTGALAMLAWMGVSALWKHVSFWSWENLFATAFFGGAALHPGFSFRTVSGTALWLVLYRVLGAAFAAATGRRYPRTRVMLLGVAFGVAWYYVSFGLLWRSAMPLVALLHPVRPTIIGHVIYGMLVGRFPEYLEPKAERPPEPPPESGQAIPEKQG
jgi:hypothetical protein